MRAFDKEIGGEEEVIGGTAWPIDGAVVADPVDERGSQRGDLG